MTNIESYNKRFDDLKREISCLRKEKIDSFNTFWEDNNHENIEILIDALTQISQSADHMGQEIPKVIAQNGGDIESSYAFIADYLMRTFNSHMLILQDVSHCVSKKLNDLDIGRKDYFEKLDRLERKLNKLGLELALK